MLTENHHLWINYKQSALPDAAGKTQATYYLKQLDLSNPATPVLGQPINVPGELLAVNGNQLYTKDFYWNGNVINHAIDMLILDHGLAYLQANYKFAGQAVDTAKVDGNHVLVSQTTSDAYARTLSVLKYANQAFTLKSTTSIAGTLQAATHGQAIVSAKGSGFLTYNYTDNNAPIVQSYFPTNGWVNANMLQIVGDSLLYPAGNAGIYRFDLSLSNINKP